MSYEKPEIGLIALAVEAIMSQQQKPGDENVDGTPFSTTSAYEADE